MADWEFTKEDFKFSLRMSETVGTIAVQAVKMANARLKQEREKEKRVGVNYCDVHHDWVEEPQMVCEYHGRAGYVVETSPWWPDYTPKKTDLEGETN